METKKSTKPSVNKVSVSNASLSRKTRRMGGSTVAIIALSVLLAVSIAVGITAAYFASNANATGTITLGNPVTIGITQGGSSVETLTFNGTAMPGTLYDQAIAVAAPANTSLAVLRGKLTLTNVGTAAENVTATVATGWTTTADADGYYYYNGTLAASASVDFVTSITVPTTLTNADATKTFTVAVVIEAIQHANGAAAEVWTNAPAEWVTAYGSGTII